MAKKNESRKEESVELTATESFFDKNKNLIFIGGGAIVAVIIGVIIYFAAFSNKNTPESDDAYWNAFYEYQYNDSTETAYEGTENFEGFESIADDYDGTTAGEIANYGMATRAMEKGEWDEALSYLDNCNFEDVMIGTLVIGMKGDCYVEKGDYDQAAQMFEEAAQREANEFTSPMFLKKAGLVYEKQGKNAEALTAYTKIKEDWSTSTEAGDIDKFIARIQ
ncbi:MAG: tetratricopeptide repeat protein [Crocinitomicaceae bacterium]